MKKEKEEIQGACPVHGIILMAESLSSPKKFVCSFLPVLFLTLFIMAIPSIITSGVLIGAIGINAWLDSIDFFLITAPILIFWGCFFLAMILLCWLDEEVKKIPDNLFLILTLGLPIVISFLIEFIWLTNKF